jgi:5-methylcytosine-specific restriction protein A
MPQKNKTHSEREREIRDRIPDGRPTAAARHYGYRHQKARERHLRREPLCRECKRIGRIVQAVIMDHIIPLGTPGGPGDVPSNRQSLCFPCHNTKTGREGGNNADDYKQRGLDNGRDPIRVGNTSDSGGSGGGGLKYL